MRALLDNGIKALLLDFDDTLIETVKYNIPGWQAAAQKAGLEHKEAAVWRERWGGKEIDLVKKVYDELISEETAREVQRLRQEEVGRSKDVIPAVPGAPQALDTLAKHYVLGIVTSRSHAKTPEPQYAARDGRWLNSLLEYRVDSAGLNLDNFAFMVGSDANKYNKPNPRVFEKPAELLAQHGIKVNDTAYVGDDIPDWRAARDASMRFFAVTTGVRTREDFLREGVPERDILQSIACLPTKLGL
jgi:phosphoglycolate phosphatase-like HAD superfamily hydrolase